MDDGVRFGEDDVVITLCDYVDQGPTSKGVIDLLLALRQRCQVITLRGNHDDGIQAVPRLVRRWRGADLIVLWLGEFQNCIGSALALHGGTLPYFQTDTHFIVDANAESNIPLESQTEDALY